MAVPERIGRYRIDRELGRGGMGVVYAAFDEQLQRPVAIKTIAAQTPDEQARRRFLREARTAARFRHPNVCHIYEISEHGFILYRILTREDPWLDSLRPEPEFGDLLRRSKLRYLEASAAYREAGGEQVLCAVAK